MLSLIQLRTGKVTFVLHHSSIFHNSGILDNPQRLNITLQPLTLLPRTRKHTHTALPVTQQLAQRAARQDVGPIVVREQLDTLALRKHDQRLGDDAAVADVDLVDGGADGRGGQEAGEALGAELGQAQLRDLAGGVQRLQRAPGARHRLDRLDGVGGWREGRVGGRRGRRGERAALCVRVAFVVRVEVDPWEGYDHQVHAGHA